MKRKRFACVAVLLLLAVAGSAGAVLWALLQVPDFYEEALIEQVDPVVRKAEAKRMVQRTLQLVDDIRHADTWSEEFAQTQVNSWLAEELHAKYADVVPRGVSDPRVRFREETIEVGFRLEHDDWKGIVSLRLKPWVPQPNRLAIEIESIRAGLVPIPLEEVLHEITKRVERQGWRIAWTESNGNDVLLLQLESVAPDSPALEHVEVLDGVVRISGQRGDAAAAGKKGTGPICAKHLTGRAGKLDLSPFSRERVADQSDSP